MKPKISIRYCPLCGWLLRSAWMAQELLTTFIDELEEVALVPAGKGEFKILCDAETIWDRSVHGGFPDVATLKQIVRDAACPDKSLGHIDKSRNSG
ncbi:SelT/SelW/SelH family protein [Hahella sp. HN01]|uniref:SelT/SelW/SelH family protein n=1 Tax=Hahella sp. HN01 TaxID=2847262 RepID=UPI001C1ECB49|nr:SelT/SelW/SelH family protein [Hahella sp. HN01]MBU6954120.1 SelT/SelW/SelH family protein [Hahella sp. HN01]